MRTAYDFSPLYRSMIGVDRVADLIDSAMRSEGDRGYPPCDVEETGTTVYYGIDAEPDLIAIPAGGFADRAFPPPQFSFYDPSRRCEWLDIRADPLERLD
jgi:hypothetical protein